MDETIAIVQEALKKADIEFPDSYVKDLASAYVNRHLLKSITFDPKTVELEDLE